MNARASRRFLLGLAAVAAVGLAVRVAYVWIVARHVNLQLGDPLGYRFMGVYLADGRGFIRPFDWRFHHVANPTAEFPPLFPAVLALGVKLGFRSQTAMMLVTTGLGVTGVVLVGLVGRRVGGAAVGLVAAAIAALHPAFWLSDGGLMAESLFVPIVAGAMLLTLVAADRRRWFWWLAAGVVCGLAALTRGEGLVLVLALVLPTLVVVTRHDGWKRVTAAGAVALAGTFVVVAPWTVRNIVVMGEVIPVSNNTGTLLAGANCADTYSGKYEGAWLYSCVAPGDDPALGEAEKATLMRRTGIDYARAHAAELPGVVAARVGRTWGVAYLANDVNLATLDGRNRTWSLVSTRVHFVVLGLAVGGAVVLARRRSRSLWVLGAMPALVTLTSALGYGSQRFRAGAEPALAVLAAVALAAAVDALASRRTPSAVVDLSEPQPAAKAPA